MEPFGKLSLKVPSNLGKEDGLETALYFADEITITPGISFYGGIRYSHFLALGPAEVLEFNNGFSKKQSNIIDTLRFEPGQVTRQYAGPEPRIALKSNAWR